MRFAVVAHRLSETNTALAAAAGGLVLTPRQALTALEPGDVALARLDVRETLDGIEPGIDDVERLAARGVRVLNPPRALLAAHDMPPPRVEFPLVIKPRFGSWGRDVTLCCQRTELIRAIEGFAFRAWFRETGGVLQDLVPPIGHDLRIIVA